MIETMLAKLNIPSPLEINGKRAETAEEWEKIRPAVAEIMQKCEYGYLPEKPEKISFEIKETDSRFCASKATYCRVEISSVINGEEFTFPVSYVYPSEGGNFKTFVHINFRPEVPDKYMPTEEIIDNGFACASFCYKDVTSDDGDFSNGLAGILYKDSQRTPYSAGKIAMWAWAAMRVMDFLETRAEVDINNVCVAGHSRLGKTALLTAAFDNRFAFAHSNCSGCSGDTLNRGKKTPENELIEAITDRFDYWFCENYKSFRGKDNETEFDQNFLLSLIAPRKIHIASAEKDLWAYPPMTFMCCAAANEVYGLYGKKGFVYTDSDYLKTGRYLNDGSIGFCYRTGTHYFSRDDWHGLFDFMNK